MQARQGGLAWMALGVVVSFAGCKSASDKSPSDEHSKDGGGSGLSGGGNDSGLNPATDAGDAPPPDLNFIPANDGKCDTAGNRDLRVVAQRALATIEDYRAQKATDLELCPTEPSDRACAPCISNPFLTWITAVDAADAGDGVDTQDRMALSDYFRRALQFPFRELLVLDAPGEQSAVVIAQGRALCGGAGECSEFALQPESMEADCATFTQLLRTAGNTELDGVSTSVSEEGERAFGFVVPLSASLPTYPLVNPTIASDAIPNACPTAAQVTTDEEFQNFLNCNPSLTVQVITPQLTRRIDADGVSCLQLTGLVAVSTLPAAARALVDTFDYEDADAPGFIRMQLAARLLDAEVRVEPLVGEAAK